MNDLLAKFSQELPRGDGGGRNGRDVEMGQFGTDVVDQDMEQFFRQEKSIQGDMAQIRLILTKLEESHQETQVITNAKALKALKDRMGKDVDEVSRVTRQIKGKLEALDRANLENRKKPNCGPGSSTDRTRMGVTSSLKVKLKELMTNFMALRQKINEEYRQVVERRVYTVTGQQADEEVIDQLIETGNSEQIFQKAIQAQGRGQILDTIAEIQERHDAVKDIERKLLELNQIFMDMAVLVEAQGELLNNIETNVGQAQGYVERATTSLFRAKKLQRNKRKWTYLTKPTRAQELL
ncbi:hypothetical protein R1flu_011717 [Riccia fluitans]|uniref:t-SNARE coiled-coil homology domain-containing protein n=1 Tax=Riccia fluitans TaxID=41844 RepID=A0ABD1Z8K0_9MARC